jgi:hypothetical protein
VRVVFAILGRIAGRAQQRTDRRRQLREERPAVGDTQPQDAGSPIVGERAESTEPHGAGTDRKPAQHRIDVIEIDAVAEELEREVPLDVRCDAGTGNVGRPERIRNRCEHPRRGDDRDEGPAHSRERSSSRKRFSNEIVANWRTMSR